MSKDSRQQTACSRQEKKSLPTVYYLLSTCKGFSLVELMITMVVFVFVIAAVSQVFTGLLTQFKQQSKIAETNIEGAIGLDILRRDIGHAGYGLPWNMNGRTYSEAASGNPPAGCPFTSGSTNTNDATSNPPRAILSINNPATFTLNNSDYLVIKATNISNSAVAQVWAPINSTDTSAAIVNTTAIRLSGTNTAFNNNNTVVVISPGIGTATTSQRVLQSLIPTTFTNVATYRPNSPANGAYVVYGVDDANMIMPFNRADYYIRRPASNMPTRCAQNTGILYKATVYQGDGSLTELPLLDCVADMQVTFCLDNDGDGTPDTNSDDISGLTGGTGCTNIACSIRQKVKEVRVYIVAQEGQKDMTYDFSMGGTRQNLSALEACGNSSRTINLADLKARIGDPDYKFYRWKLYTIVVKPNDLL